ncbi:hypothetical protein PSACC_02032 [Paramicrosporidium saccamoebae]|uniref:Uncharacterized protein n=1 Tax=Paramicrosporidium saccamoebae TaxID=1246581 RepID=A0A2H9TK86_9FUNG|nr:hypothetical protein PSACC_02032 [Paramicrosporidium saccamoebae]
MKLSTVVSRVWPAAAPIALFLNLGMGSSGTGSEGSAMASFGGFGGDNPTQGPALDALVIEISSLQLAASDKPTAVLPIVSLDETDVVLQIDNPCDLDISVLRSELKNRIVLASKDRPRFHRYLRSARAMTTWLFPGAYGKNPMQVLDGDPYEILQNGLLTINPKCSRWLTKYNCLSLLQEMLENNPSCERDYHKVYNHAIEEVSVQSRHVGTFRNYQMDILHVWQFD